jgi:ABC-type uncharacterized transport system substrate-binding protein
LQVFPRENKSTKISGDRVSRREFITLLGSTAVAWPMGAAAQQAMPVIGFLNTFSPEVWAPFVAAFRRGLKETGYVEGQNVLIEYRWPQSQVDPLPSLAADLVRRAVTVIVASGGDQFVQAARAATATIPIVGTFGFDPVENDLVASLNRPGGNVTGVSLFSTALVAKRLDLLRELVPNVSIIAFLANPTIPQTVGDRKTFEAAAQTLEQRVLVVTATNEQQCEAAFATLVRQGAGALLIESDAFFDSIQDRLVALAKRHSVPVVCGRREFVKAGGLMSYETSPSEAYRQLGIYTGRILGGEKPADLPVTQPAKFDLAVNLKTAKALGIAMPPTLLAAADEVIE